MSIFKTSDFKNPISLIENSAKKIGEINNAIQIGKIMSSPEARREIAKWGIKKGIKYTISGGKDFITDAIKYLKK